MQYNNIKYRPVSFTQISSNIA